MGGRRTAASAPEQPQTKHTKADLGLRRFTVTETREAWLVTTDNLDDVAAWCGGRVDGDCVWVPVAPLSDIGAEVGDYVVRLPDGYTAVRDWLFERDYASKWTEVDEFPDEPEPPVYGCLTGQPLRVTRR